MRERLVACLAVLVGAVLLLVPAAINRAPFIFYDTTHYLEVGQSILAPAHLRFAIFDRAAPAATPAAPAVATPPAAAMSTGPDQHESLAYIGGRSPYYSVVLVLLVGVIGLWGAVFVQALIGSYLGWRVVALGGGTQRLRAARLLALLALLAIASTLPYFVGYVMPDIYAGYALVALALLMVPPALLPVPHRVALTAIAIFSVLAHATNLALAVMAVVFGAVVLRWSGLRWRATGARLKWAGAALGLGLLGAPLFALACLLALGDTPQSPPYLVARVLADGPGRVYLADVCGRTEAPAICAFKDKRLDNHNDILWSTEAERSVFQAADYATKRQLKREELRFVLGAVAHSPRLALDAAVHNAAAQLSTFAIAGEIGATKRSWETMLNAAIPSAGEQITDSRGFRGSYPFAVVDPVQIAGFVAGLAGLAVFLLRAENRAVWHHSGADDPDLMARRQLVGLVLALLAIFVLNAVMCGVLSGPTPRYQGRLTWLVPALALVLLGGRRR